MEQLASWTSLNEEGLVHDEDKDFALALILQEQLHAEEQHEEDEALAKAVEIQLEMELLELQEKLELELNDYYLAKRLHEQLNPEPSRSPGTGRSYAMALKGDPNSVTSMHDFQQPYLKSADVEAIFPETSSSFSRAATNRENEGYPRMSFAQMMEEFRAYRNFTLQEGYELRKQAFSISSNLQVVADKQKLHHKMIAVNRKAAAILFYNKNPELKLFLENHRAIVTKIDLHLLLKAEAIERMHAISEIASRFRWTELVVICGSGNHSVGNRPVLGPAVKAFFERHGQSVKEISSGTLHVNFRA